MRTVSVVSVVLGLVAIAAGQTSSSASGSSCPEGWTSNKNSCYFTGQRFNGQTWYSAASFCESFGAHLVEINDQDEFNWVQAKIKSITWQDGPWVGMIRLFGDMRWYLPSIHGQGTNNQLNSQISALASRATNDCGGFDAYGNNFGFWRCRNGGSPICEMDMQ